MATTVSTGPGPFKPGASVSHRPLTVAITGWRSREGAGSRLFSSGIFLVLLTTLAMTWVSFSVPGCFSELHAREPTGAEAVGGTTVTVTGVIEEDCWISFGVICDRVEPIDGRFSIDGTAPVAGLLAIVIVGAALMVLNGPIGFRLREGVALWGALLMAVVAMSPESTLDISWKGTPAKPDVEAGAGPVIGAGLFVAILFVNLVLELWGRSKGRRMLLVLLADVGFVVVCGAVAFLGMIGPAILLLAPVVPPLLLVVGGLETGTSPKAELTVAEEPVARKHQSVLRRILFGSLATVTVGITAGIGAILLGGVAAGISAADQSAEDRISPGLVTPTPYLPRATLPAGGYVPTATATPKSTSTSSTTPTSTATSMPTAASSPTPTGMVNGGVAVVANLGGSVLRVRSGPGVQFSQIGSLREGDRVTLISDRQVDATQDYAWWQVRLAGGTVGWAAEGRVNGSERWLVAARAAPTPTSVPPTPDG